MYSFMCPPLSPIRAEFGVQDYNRNILFLAKFCFDLYILSPLRGDTGISLPPPNEMLFAGQTRVRLETTH